MAILQPRFRGILPADPQQRWGALTGTILFGRLFAAWWDVHLVSRQFGPILQPTLDPKLMPMQKLSHHPESQRASDCESLRLAYLGATTPPVRARLWLRRAWGLQRGVRPVAAVVALGAGGVMLMCRLSCLRVRDRNNSSTTLSPGHELLVMRLLAAGLLLLDLVVSSLILAASLARSQDLLNQSLLPIPAC